MSDPKTPSLNDPTPELAQPPESPKAQGFASQPDHVNPPAPERTTEVQPKPAQPFARDPRRNVGGPATHKPGCICRACASRRRKKEAELVAAGIPLTGPKAASRTKGVLNADLPPIIVRGRSLRDRIADWAIMRATDPKLSNKDIAERLGIGEATLNVMITKATKEGWLVFEDPMKRLEHQILPMVVDNLHGFVADKDKMVTVEVAKGALFPAYKEHKGIQEAPTNVLALKIEMPEGMKEMPTIRGVVTGVPRTEEATIDVQPVLLTDQEI